MEIIMPVIEDYTTKTKAASVILKIRGSFGQNFRYPKMSKQKYTLEFV